MKTVTVKQIQKLDQVAIHQFGIPSLVLMENAGRAVFHCIEKSCKGKHVVVICGMGNNAGDGFVIARHLVDAGINTRVLFIGQISKLKDDALTNLSILKKMRIKVVNAWRLSNTIKRDIRQADIIVDAIFGVGLNREIDSPFKEYIDIVNESAARVISVDVPSGLDATTGHVYGCCIKANRTISFSFAKKGFFLKAGEKCSGRISIVDIGIPEMIKSKVIK